jgi:hypothetical protein
MLTRFYGTSLYSDFLGDLIFLGLISHRLTSIENRKSDKRASRQDILNGENIDL